MKNILWENWRSFTQWCQFDPVSPIRYSQFEIIQYINWSELMLILNFHIGKGKKQKVSHTDFFKSITTQQDTKLIPWWPKLDFLVQFTNPKKVQKLNQNMCMELCLPTYPPILKVESFWVETLHSIIFWEKDTQKCIIEIIHL